MRKGLGAVAVSGRDEVASGDASEAEGALRHVGLESGRDVSGVRTLVSQWLWNSLVKSTKPWKSCSFTKNELAPSLYARLTSASSPGGCEHDYGKAANAFLLAYPGENLETVHARHLQVQEDQNGQRVLSTIGVLTFAAEVGDSLFAAANGLDRVAKRSPVERPLRPG